MFLNFFVIINGYTSLVATIQASQKYLDQNIVGGEC